MKDIVTATSEIFNIPVNDMMSRKRRADLVNARNHAILACLKYTRNGYSDIGRFFNRDHSTIMYVEKVMPKRVKPKVLSDRLDSIRRMSKVA